MGNAARIFQEELARAFFRSLGDLKFLGLIQTFGKLTWMKSWEKILEKFDELKLKEQNLSNKKFKTSENLWKLTELHGRMKLSK